MVFHCRCFSFEQEDIEYETRTYTKSTSTEEFYTAYADHNLPVPNFHAPNLRIFTVAELKAATKNFSSASKIGEGGFGSVFKGVIKSLERPFDEIQVAVKYANGLLQRRKEWVTEINVLGVVKHPNLVKLVGYCVEDNKRGTQLLLVYEYMPNRSVRDHLSTKSKTPLSWNMRLKVAQDAARSLAYLHEQMDYQIIFRDFKSSNILLDGQWNAKLSDFGVARLGPCEGRTHISTKFAGTMSYAAPEYIETGHLSAKCDVWSYGVFLCELITGRPPLDKNRPHNEKNLLQWVKPCLNSKNLILILDPRLQGKYSPKSAQKLSCIAKRCLYRDPKLRPKMSEVFEMVNKLIGVPSQAINPAPPFKKVFMGVTMAKKTHEDQKRKEEAGYINIQLRVSAHSPQKRSTRLLKC